MPAEHGEHVLWHDDVAPPVANSERPSTSADVVVVGAGYAGLSAAKALAGRGRSVVVVEAGALGWGAHSRNGGMVLPELKQEPAHLRRRYGDLGLRMYDDVDAAFNFVEALIDSAAIDCDYRRCGELYLAHSARRVAELHAVVDEHRQRGDDVRFVAPEHLGDEIGSSVFHGGALFERAGSLHPAKFHAGLAGLAMDAGAVVVDHCAATAVTRRQGAVVVTTERGEIRAGDVVVTTNAYADGLIPALRRRVLPVGSFIVATEPLQPALADELSPRRRMFVDTKNFLSYWRLTPDGRMLFGGRKRLGAVTLDDAARYLTAALRRTHPQLASTAITHRWGGRVAITLDRLPHVGRIGDAWYATGCNGSGVALNTWLGHRLAEHLLDEAPLPSFAELTHRTIPLFGARRLWQPVVGQWFRWRDYR